MESDNLSRRSLLQAIAATFGHCRAALGLGRRSRRPRTRRMPPSTIGRRSEDVVSQRGRSGGHRSRRRADHSDRRLRPARARRASCTSSTGPSRRFSRSSPATIARSSPRFRRHVANGIPAPHRSRRSRSEQQIEYLKGGRPDAVLRHDAAAHAPRHVFAARVRRQSRRRRLEADRLRRRRTSFEPPFGYYDRDYPGFVIDPEKTPMSTQTYRDSDTVDFVIVGSGAAGGVMARELAQAGLSVVRAGAGAAASRRGLQARRARRTGTSAASPTTRSRIRRRSATMPGKKAELQKFKPPLWYGRARRRREPALHGELLALPRDRLHRAQRARRDSRHRLRRLADHLRRSRAVLHQGRVGDRRLGPRRREPVRSAAHASRIRCRRCR